MISIESELTEYRSDDEKRNANVRGHNHRRVRPRILSVPPSLFNCLPVYLIEKEFLTNSHFSIFIPGTKFFL